MQWKPYHAKMNQRSHEQKLTPEEFHNAYSDAAKELRRHSWKVEVLQFYDEEGDPSWQKMIKGDWDGALNSLTEAVQEDLREIQDLRRDGIRVSRLRIIERPLSDYLRWELESYKLSASAGEEIFILDKAGMAEEAHLQDLVGFDENEVILLNYDAAGKLTSAVRISDTKCVRNALEAYDHLLSRAVPLDDFMRA